MIGKRKIERRRCGEGGRMWELRGDGSPGTLPRKHSGLNSSGAASQSTEPDPHPLSPPAIVSPLRIFTTTVCAVVAQTVPTATFCATEWPLVFMVN